MLEAPLIVNTTSVGMHPQVRVKQSGLIPSHFPPAHLFTILSTIRGKRASCSQAKEANCKTSNGLGMLIHQGALAFELWTGQKPSLQVMEMALEATRG